MTEVTGFLHTILVNAKKTNEILRQDKLNCLSQPESFFNSCLLLSPADIVKKHAPACHEGLHKNSRAGTGEYLMCTISPEYPGGHDMPVLNLGRELEQGLASAFDGICIPLSSQDKFEWVKEALEDIVRENREASSRLLKMLLGIETGEERDDRMGEIFLHSVSTAVYTAMLLEDRCDSDFHKYRLSVIQAALFHDIGKSRVAKDVLFKPSSLSGEEYEKMKEHTGYGVPLLTPFNYSRPVIPVAALYHHFPTGNYGGAAWGKLPKEIRVHIKGNVRMRQAVDAISMADSISAVMDSRIYSNGKRGRLSRVVGELYRMCAEEKYLSPCRERLDRLCGILGL
jgi:hypothetical protein